MDAPADRITIYSHEISQSQAKIVSIGLRSQLANSTANLFVIDNNSALLAEEVQDLLQKCKECNIIAS